VVPAAAVFGRLFDEGADTADGADGIFGIGVEFTETIRRPLWSALMNSNAIPRAQRLPEMRRGALASALGVFHQCAERRFCR
jgi:hypothetical protein